MAVRRRNGATPHRNVLLHALRVEVRELADAPEGSVKAEAIFMSPRDGSLLQQEFRRAAVTDMPSVQAQAHAIQRRRSQPSILPAALGAQSARRLWYFAENVRAAAEPRAHQLPKEADDFLTALESVGG